MELDDKLQFYHYKEKQIVETHVIFMTKPVCLCAELEVRRPADVTRIALYTDESILPLLSHASVCHYEFFGYTDALR